MTFSVLYFFFNATATTEIYTLSLTTLFRSDQSDEQSDAVRGGRGRGQRRGRSPRREHHDPWARNHRRQRLFRAQDRKSTRLNSSHLGISYAVFCLKKKTKRTRCDIRKQQRD